MLAHAYNPALGKLRLEDLEFKDSLAYIGRPRLKQIIMPLSHPTP